MGEDVEVGSTVQFLLRDATAAHDDLAAVLAAFRRRIGLATARGSAALQRRHPRPRDLPEPDHDVLAVRGELGLASVAGFFASGEIGPVGGRNHVQGCTATVLAFGT